MKTLSFAPTKKKKNHVHVPRRREGWGGGGLWVGGWSPGWTARITLLNIDPLVMFPLFPLTLLHLYPNWCTHLLQLDSQQFPVDLMFSVIWPIIK